jgi:hypothetical protein
MAFLSALTFMAPPFEEVSSVESKARAKPFCLKKPYLAGYLIWSVSTGLQKCHECPTLVVLSLVWEWCRDGWVSLAGVLLDPGRQGSLK